MDGPLTPAEALVRFPHAVLSHESAARLLGLGLLDDSGSKWLTVPRGHRHVRLAGWQIRRTDLHGGSWQVLSDGQRLTTVTRTACDLARTLPLDQAVALADSAIQRGLARPQDLLAVLSESRGRGASRPRTVARLIDGRAESVLESALRVLIVTSSLPAPQLQLVIRGARGRGIRADFCWPAERLVVEADGFAFHSDRLAYRRDRERMNELERLGWRVLRFTYEDIRSRPAYVLTLIAECLARAAVA